MITVQVKKAKAPVFVQAARMLTLRVKVSQETSPGMIDVKFKDLNDLDQVALVAKASATPRSAIWAVDPATGIIAPLNKIRF
jgi:hypothetical protein